MRIPGLAGKAYATLGVDVKLLPGGEIFPALERGVIDAAEFVGPHQDRRLGLQKAAKFYYTTGWHEPATVSELLINRAAWNKLPKDLQAIVENACAACNVISEGWCQKTNAEAMEDLVKNQGVIARPLPDDVIAALRSATKKGAGRGRRQGSGDEEGSRFVHGLQGEVRRVEQLQRNPLSHQDSGLAR
jgi:TRAP-type mannitol/chloroaromatic compound transport system substrate-binding protein